MRGYSATEIFDVRDSAILATAQEMVARFPEGEWRCHEVARAVARECVALGLRVVDGKYCRVDHSWLAYRGTNKRLRILDTYAVGMLPQVLLLDASSILDHGSNYVPSHLPRADIREDDVTKLREAARG